MKKPLLALVLLVSLVSCRTPIELLSPAEEIPALPAWTASANWYQIFPERFYNADTTNDPTAERIKAPSDWKITPWTADWYQRAPWESRLTPTFYDETVFMRRLGGDLQGVIQKLDYLDSLGVNALYFNPVFDAVSLHKYDGSTYHHIDRHFGPDPEGDAKLMASENPADPSTWVFTKADSLFLKLLSEAKRRNIKIIVDGVWNHTGPEFWAFQDILKHQQNSPYKDWYTVKAWDDPSTAAFEFDYKGWWDYKGLPEFRDVNGDLPEGVKAYIFASTRRWMDPNNDGDPSDGIDGWRLDVAEEVGIPFWKQWHRVVRELNPNAITVAEIWTDKALEYLDDDLFGIVMNYRWAYPTVDFFINKTLPAQAFLERQQQILSSYPMQKQLSMQNLLDSHDTDRLFSMIVNPGREYDRKASPRDKDNPNYQIAYPGVVARETLQLIALYQYTWPGAPMIFYGTEVGMWGADDPDDRKPMLWPEFSYADEVGHPLGFPRRPDPVKVDNELYQWYRSLMHLRTDHPALRLGSVRAFYAEDSTGVIGYQRTYQDETLFTLINPSSDRVDLRIALNELKAPQVRHVQRLLGRPSSAEVKVLQEDLVATLPPRSGLVFSLK